jgi:hypothetical protein
MGDRNLGIRLKGSDSARNGPGHSVQNFVGFLGPRAKSDERFVAHNLNGGDAALGVGLFQFAIDEGVVESDFRGIFGGVGKIDARKASPVDGTETHGARLAGRVDFAILELEVT